MLRPLRTRDSEDGSWLGAFANDFHRRFLSLLSYQFREFPAVMALSIDESADSGAKLDPLIEAAPLIKADLDRLLTPFDLKRLGSYASHMLDYHVVLDLIPTLAILYFTGPLKSVIKLTGVQKAILLAIGVQRKDMDQVSAELSLPSSQLLAMFIKILRKITAHFESLVSGEIEAEMPNPDSVGTSRENASAAHDIQESKFVALETSLGDELEEVGDEALGELRAKQRELIDSLPLDQ
jgi:N-acetyltransferase 10